MRIKRALARAVLQLREATPSGIIGKRQQSDTESALDVMQLNTLELSKMFIFDDLLSKTIFVRAKLFARRWSTTIDATFGRLRLTSS